MTVKTIPEGYHSVTPYLSIKGAAEAMDFYNRAFNATKLFRLVAPPARSGTPRSKKEDLSPEEINKRATARFKKS